jgi:hypothetical protein
MEQNKFDTLYGPTDSYDMHMYPMVDIDDLVGGTTKEIYDEISGGYVIDLYPNANSSDDELFDDNSSLDISETESEMSSDELQDIFDEIKDDIPNNDSNMSLENIFADDVDAKPKNESPEPVEKNDAKTTENDSKTAENESKTTENGSKTAENESKTTKIGGYEIFGYGNIFEDEDYEQETEQEPETEQDQEQETEQEPEQESTQFTNIFDDLDEEKEQSSKLNLHVSGGVQYIDTATHKISLPPIMGGDNSQHTNEAFRAGPRMVKSFLPILGGKTLKKLPENIKNAQNDTQSFVKFFSIMKDNLPKFPDIVHIMS